MTRRSRASLEKIAAKQREASEGKEADPVFDAAIYRSIRNMDPGKASTLKKAMRARRIENGKRPLSMRDDIPTKREKRIMLKAEARVKKGFRPFYEPISISKAGVGHRLLEMLYENFLAIIHAKSLH